MKITFLKWGAVPLALLVSAAGASTVLAQDQSSSQSSPAAATPAQQPAKKPTAAHYGNNKVGQRRENQQDRIAQGVKSGQLTAGETAKLEKQQKGINTQVAKDRKANGGTLTASEKKQINKEQNQASRNIYRKKHNAATQPNAKPKQ
jgi:predicted transglutaminase-like cysteine proteinase